MTHCKECKHHYTGIDENFYTVHWCKKVSCKYTIQQLKKSYGNCFLKNPHGQCSDFEIKHTMNKGYVLVLLMMVVFILNLLIIIV